MCVCVCACVTLSQQLPERPPQDSCPELCSHILSQADQQSEDVIRWNWLVSQDWRLQRLAFLDLAGLAKKTLHVMSSVGQVTGEGAPLATALLLPASHSA